MTRVRCAATILKHANKAREREIIRRLDAIETQTRPVRVDLGRRWSEATENS